MIVAGVATVVLAVSLLVSVVVRPPSPATNRAPFPSSVGQGPLGEKEGLLTGFLHGRVTTDDGATLAGRLRFGGNEEAFWDDDFNGFKDENPWAEFVAAEHLTERRPIEIFGVEIARRQHEIDLRRPFAARFGDIARIEADGRDIRVTLKSGTEVKLDRFAADDLSDGLRIWDDRYATVELGEWRIREITFSSNLQQDVVPSRLHGTIQTKHARFTGAVRWGRSVRVGRDEIDAYRKDGKIRLRFDAVRSIARRVGDQAQVTLRDGRDLTFPGIGDVGGNGRGVYVDDRRYGRVLIPWEAFERVDFDPHGLETAVSLPAYDEFLPGQPLSGKVITRRGQQLVGRLVYDLDESETTDRLDAPSRGVTYNIPFTLIASIVPADTASEKDPPLASVTLRSGEVVTFEPEGDLGDANAGLLVFTEGRETPTYVPWRDVEQIDLDPTPSPDLSRLEHEPTADPQT